MTTKYRIEVQTNGRWVPGVRGMLNQTGQSDDQASTWDEPGDDLDEALATCQAEAPGEYRIAEIATITVDPSDPFAGLVVPEEQGEVLAGWLREKSAHVLAVEMLSSASAAGCGTWDDEALRALTKALKEHEEMWTGAAR